MKDYDFLACNWQFQMIECDRAPLLHFAAAFEKASLEYFDVHYFLSVLF